MHMIKVPQLRMAQLQTFTEGVLQTTKDLAEVSAQVALYSHTLRRSKRG